MNENPGDKIGECTFLRFAPKRPPRTERRGIFLCRCGKEFDARIDSIAIGKTKSCGCYSKILQSAPHIEYANGDKIGVLTFLNRVPSEPERPKANFLCECGKEFVTRMDSAKSCVTKSCGCKSKELIAEASRSWKRKPFKRPSNKAIPELTEEQKSRFWAKIAVTANPNRCWAWLATGAYGMFRIGQKMYLAHRIAYLLVKGEDPSEMELLHSCDNPKCCNPEHLSPGTHWDNMQDMAEKGRAYNGKIKRESITN